MSTEPRKISVAFERKKDLGNYQNTTVKAWIEDEVPADADGATISQKIVDLLNACKAGALDSLGIEVFMDDTGVVREKHEPVVTVTQAAASIGNAFPGTTQATGSAGYSTGGLKVMNPEKLVENVPQFVIDKCAEKGIVAIWANNGQYGPFYKEAVQKGETPKIPDQRDPSKAGIIKNDS